MVGMYVANGSCYIPGPKDGFTDRRLQPLRTLQDFLEGGAEYVSTAFDQNLSAAYGTKFRIWELEARYGKKIEFRVVDVEDAYKNQGYGKIDICVRDHRSLMDPTLNGKLTLIFG